MKCGLQKRRRTIVKPVKVFDDGREVCDLSVAAGRREYRRRVELMLALKVGAAVWKAMPRCAQDF